MEGLKAYNIVDDMKIKMNEVIKDNILDNKDIDINYDVFIDEHVGDGNVQELGDVSSLEGEIHPHFFQFVSQTFHIFMEQSYTYVISCLQHKIEVNIEGIECKLSFGKSNLS